MSKIKSEMTEEELQASGDPTIPDDLEDLGPAPEPVKTEESGAAAAAQPAATTETKADAEQDAENPEGAQEADGATATDPAAQPEQTEQPALIAGKFKSIEDLIEAYKHAESKIGQESAARVRAERLAIELAKAPARPATEAPATPAQKRREIVSLISRAALEEDGIDDDGIVDAIVDRIINHPRASAAVAEHISSHNEVNQAVASLRGAFFTEHEALKEVDERALFLIAKSVEEEAMASPDVQAGLVSAPEFFRRTLEETASRAYKVFKIDRTQPASNGNGNAATTAPPVSRVQRQPVGTRSERPSARAATPPALQGQEKEIAEIEDML